MIAVAHRVPRTAEAVRTWLDAGATRFEADVQLSPDTGEVVVSHFLPFLQLPGWLQHDGRRFRWRAGPPYDPTLADVIDLLPDGTDVLLDPKERDPARRTELVDALAAALPDPGRFAVSTDHDSDLNRYRAAGFTTWRTVKDAAGLRRLLDAGPLPDAGTSIRHSLLDEGVVQRLHDGVPLVVAWTVNDAARARELLAAGVDGVTTDRPEIARLVTAS